MKMTKKLSRRLEKLINGVVILVMLLQPVGTPGLLLAIAEAPATEPVSEQVEEVAVVEAEMPVEEPAPTVEEIIEAIPATTEEVEPVPTVPDSAPETEEADVAEEAAPVIEIPVADPEVPVEIPVVVDVAVEEKTAEIAPAFATDTFEVLAPEQLEQSCGDGIINGEEQCDDGNENNGDACSNSCELKKMQKEEVRTCNGEGELYLYVDDPFQAIATSFTTERDQLLIFTGNPPVYSLDIKVNGITASKTKIFADKWVEIFSVDTVPGALVTVEGSSENGARNVQGYLAQDKTDPIYDIAATEVIWDDARTSYMYLTPGEYTYLFFDKYTYNNKPSGSKDERKLNVKINGLNSIVDKTYTAPFPSPVEGAVVENYSIAQTGTYAMTVDSEDSVYWAMPKCEPLVPLIEVDKVANPTTLPEPGGEVIFTFTVTNTGIDPVTITSLSDDKFGLLSGDADCQIGTDLASNESCTFDSVQNLAGNGGATHTNIFTAHAENNEGTDATDNDDATVEIIDVLPTVTLEKTVDDDSKPEPGGTFNYTLTITNTSAEDVTIISLTDDNALSQECLDLIDKILKPSEQVSCNYSVINTEAGNYPNTAKVTVEDDEKKSASAEDSKSVEVTDALPTVTLEKTVDEDSKPEPGGTFNYTLTITNTSAEDVTIISLTDDNALSQECLDLIGDILIPNQPVSCKYSVTQTEAGIYPNTAAVTVEDNEKSSASDEDSESVEVTDVLPVIEVLKTAGVAAVNVPSASVTFTFTVKNNSIEAVTITRLTDNVFGPLSGDADCQVGTELDPGAACSFDSMENVSGSAGGAHINVFTAHAEDNEKNDATAFENETVVFNAGRIIVDKITDPAGETQSFDFTFSGGPSPAVNQNFSLADSSAPYDSGLLFPGTYSVIENAVVGWQTSASCYVGNEIIFDSALAVFTDNVDPNNIVLEPNQTIRCTFTNTFTPPILTIEKFNDQWPNIQDPGDIVDYTIIVRASQNNVNGAFVKDLMPDGFIFADITSVKKNGSDLAVVNPAYASPGTWKLGDLVKGDEVVIKFKATIGNNQDPGTYKDLAWAQGTDDRQMAVLATSVPAPKTDPGVITNNFVGTQIELAPVTQPEAVILAESTKTETKTKRKTKRVLGAAILPATGANPTWPLVALIILIIGFNLIMESKKRAQKNLAALNKNIMKIFIFTLFSGAMIFSAQAAQAAADPSISVRVEKPPAQVASNEFKIGFVALDIQERNLIVKCFKTPAEEVANDFVVKAGGNAGSCLINLPDGTYQFYVVAYDPSNADNYAQSENVTVEINTGAPGTPLNYSRAEDSCTVNFTTANDGLTNEVELYRSIELAFTADDATYVGNIAVNPNTAGSVTDSSGSCGDYFYAIRAVSAAGVGSAFVGDEKVTVKHKTRTRTRTVIIHPEATTGAIPAANESTTTGGAIPGAGSVEGAATAEEQSVPGEEGAVLGEETEGADETATAQENFLQKNRWLFPVGVLIILAAIYVYRKKRNPGIEK